MKDEEQLKVRVIKRLHDLMKETEDMMDNNTFNPNLYIAIIHCLRDLRNL